MPRVLITGGTGFVGAHLIRHLQPTTPDIVVMASDKGATGARPDGAYYELDLVREDDVRNALREIRPAQIYHLAGVSAVGEASANVRRTFEVNVAGACNLFAAAMDLPSPPRILNISTAQVYAPSDEPLTEESPIRPDNPYAASKAMAELLEVSFRRASGGGILTARSFNHTGPGQLPGFVLSSFAKQFVEIEMGLMPAKLKVGNIEVKRDFSDVRDVVRAYAGLLGQGRIGQVYNVCSGVGVRLSDLLRQFQALCKTAVQVEVDPARLRSGEAPQVVGDPAKIRKETGWKTLIPIEQTIRDLVDDWREKIGAAGAAAVSGNATPQPAERNN